MIFFIIQVIICYIVEAYRMQNAECRMQNAECRMQNAECRMQNAECRMQNALKI